MCVSFLEACGKDRNEIPALYQTLSTKLFWIVVALNLGSPEDSQGGHWCQMRGIRVGLKNSEEQSGGGRERLQNFPVGNTEG